jgi:hypothetical protein
MIFDLEMADLMDDNVDNIFGREMDEAEIERNFLIVGAGSSLGRGFSDVELRVFFT